MRISRKLKADIERGFIVAYYKYIKKCSVNIDDEYFTRTPFVAVAYSKDTVYGMDFSTLYHFDEQAKPKTLVRRVKRRVEAIENYCKLMGIQRKTPITPLYEIWCFIPANIRVTETVESALKQGLPVKLVMYDEVLERLRQTVLSLPETDEDENAFVQAAKMIKEAFKLK
ncbi:MAG: hypothetical protein PWQ82_1352 [Thermosediminibacterales bacterium]|nr:hypothetical protein [Thermosediminibacterales bacterium]MDK2835618.1 hypothetical protein [Thermosediminibacterales bacterium]